MGTHKPWLIVIACTVNLVLLPAQAYDGTIRRFQNFFDSVANNDVKGGDTYRGILRHEVAEEQRNFDTVKEEFWDTRNKKFRKRNSFFGKIKEGENIVAVKRAINICDEDNGTYTFPEIRTRDAFQPTLKLLRSQKKHLNQTARIYDRMKTFSSDTNSMKGRMNEANLDDLNATIFWLGNIIDMDTETVNKMNHGEQKVDNDDRKIPWRDASSSIVLHHWNMIKKYSSEIHGADEMMKERNAMMQVAELGIYEVNEYKKYVKNVLPVFTAPTPREIFVTNGTNIPKIHRKK